MNPYNISFIGAGKLAGVLCMELYDAGYRINRIISAKGNSAALLAQKCDSESSVKLDIPEQTDLLIIAVPDKLIGSVLTKLQNREDLVIAHTSGSIGLDVFENRFKHTGVFYPLQTFSAGRNVKFSEIPVFVEASDSYAGSLLESVANKISRSVYNTDSSIRRMIHLSAVFISNFTNHMLTEGKLIAAKAGFPFDILIPLLNETIKKAVENGPENSQTGPALRNDVNTIEKHMELLSFSPELKNVYKEITNSIIKRYNN